MKRFKRILSRTPSFLLTTRNPLRRLVRGLFLGLIIAFLTGGAFYAGWFGNFRHQLTDVLYTDAATTDDVVIIAIDDKSLSELGRSPATWDRSNHAQLVDFLATSGARVISFDILFDIPAAQDETLSEAILNARRTGTKIVLTIVGHESHEKLDNGSADFTLFFKPVDTFRAVDYGHVNVFPDQDGIIRSIPLVAQTDEEQFYALGLTTYLAGLGLGAELTRYEDNRIEFPAQEGFDPSWVIKTDDDGRMLITYFGEPSHVDDPNSTFLAYSYVDVLNGEIPAEAFTGKIVLIGALDSVGQPDFFPTPISRDERMYGVEIHASVIETINQLNRRPDARIRRAQLENLPEREQLLYIIGIAFAAGIIMPFLRWHMAILVMLFAGMGYLYWAFYEFYTNGQIIDLFYPWLAIGLSLIGTLIINYTFEERRRHEINELFSRYVSPEIARKVVESYDKGQLKLGGEERQITVLFADIRGFTTLAEGLTPIEVLTLLNSFLEQMNTIVLKYHGTINKYIGDNLMAFWNAPYTQHDHAWLATQAALELLRVVQDINKTGEFKAPVLFGIGINTGNAVIGNIGSQERLEYTPIGDTVNIASRLSGVAEGGACLMGETTYEAIKNHSDIQPTSQQEVMLKGKRLAINVYEIKA